MAKRFLIEKLDKKHKVDGFDCGNKALNKFLDCHALVGQLSNISQTYVGLADEEVVGFYTLTVGQVSLEVAPPRLKKGMPQYPIPIMLLARLAVSSEWQKQGIGSGLLKDALKRTMQVADIADMRALAVHAKDESAQAFYAYFNFMLSPTDPYHMFLLLKDLKKTLGV